jgi:hypothetical protein
MPLKNVRYRWVDPGKPGGKKVRLAFRGNKVVEAKSTSGKVHTPKEFMQDEAKRRYRDTMKSKAKERVQEIRSKSR